MRYLLMAVLALGFLGGCGDDEPAPKGSALPDRNAQLKKMNQGDALQKQLRKDSDPNFNSAERFTK
jgi:hypothetical protein